MSVDGLGARRAKRREGAGVEDEIGRMAKVGADPLDQDGSESQDDIVRKMLSAQATHESETASTKEQPSRSSKAYNMDSHPCPKPTANARSHMDFLINHIDDL